MIVNWSSAYLFLVLTYSHNSRFSLVLKGQTTHADVAELADALDSGSSVLTDVEVQILSSALGKNRGFWSFGWKPLFSYQKKNTRKTPNLAKSPFLTGSFDELTATTRAEIKLPFSVKEKSTFTIWATNVCRFTE
jgi:hypothetical protein